MKEKKPLRRLTKIQSLMSDVTQRYSANALVREVLQDAKVAVTRAKDAVSSQASSGAKKNPPVKQVEPTSNATPETSKPKRKLTAAGRKAISTATKRRWALKRQEAGESSKGASKKPAGRANAAVESTPAQAATKAAS